MSWHSASRNDGVCRDGDAWRASAEPRQRHRACHSTVEAFLVLVTDEGSEDSNVAEEAEREMGMTVSRFGGWEKVQGKRGENASQAINRRQ